jgi:hypothetical protein
MCLYGYRNKMPACIFDTNLFADDLCETLTTLSLVNRLRSHG